MNIYHSFWLHTEVGKFKANAKELDLLEIIRILNFLLGLGQSAK